MFLVKLWVTHKHSTISSMVTLARRRSVRAAGDQYLMGSSSGTTLEQSVQIYLTFSFSGVKSHISSCQNADAYCLKMPTCNIPDTLLFRMITNITRLEIWSWAEEDWGSLFFKRWPGRKLFIFHFSECCGSSKCQIPSSLTTGTSVNMCLCLSCVTNGWGEV